MTSSNVKTILPAYMREKLDEYQAKHDLTDAQAVRLGLVLLLGEDPPAELPLGVVLELGRPVDADAAAERAEDRQKLAESLRARADQLDASG